MVKTNNNSQPAKGREEPGRNTIERILARLFISLMTVILLFVALESGCRIWIMYFCDDESFLYYASISQLKSRFSDPVTGELTSIYSPHRYLGYYPTPFYSKGKNRHNALGYRGSDFEHKKPEGEKRIVCMGGSTTYSLGVEDWQLSYPAQLERLLHERDFTNYRVINAGAVSWQSWESLVNIQFRVQDLDPDLIIVMHGINDIESRLVYPFEKYLPDNSGRRTATFYLNYPELLHYSSLVRIILLKRGLMKPFATFDLVDPRPASYLGAEFKRQLHTQTYPQGIFKKVPLKTILDKNRPIYYRRNMALILESQLKSGGKAVLGTLAWLDSKDDTTHLSDPDCLRALSEMNNVTRSLASDYSVLLFDFANVFPFKEEYFTDQIHLNDQGNRIKAGLMADFLINHELL